MKSLCADIFNHLYTLPHGSITTFSLLLLLLFISPPLIPLVGAQKSSSDSTISGGDSLNTNNVSPSMAVIVIVLVLAFFITGCVSIYIQQCAETASSSTIPAFLVAAGDGRSRRGSVRGLDRSVIATFPTFLYSAVKELKIGKGSLECAVCLNEFEDEETLRLLPKCDHVFHPDCIDTWLAGHTTCPVCRANLVPEQPLAGNSAESTHGIDSDGELEVSTSGEDNSRCEVQIITINEEGTANVNIPKRNPNRKFPRSHSTGHSLSRPADDWERYTLRLPAEVRRQLVVRARLKRATSLVALPRESSSRRGCRSSGDREGSGSSRYGRLFGRGSGRWPFNFALPAFVSRDGSFRSTATKVAAEGDVTAGSVSSKRSGGTAVTPLEFLPPLPV